MADPIRSATPPKPVLLFAVHALLLSLLLGYWPSARALYPTLFRAQAQAVFGSGDPPSLIVREAIGDHLQEKDTFIEALGPAGGEPRWRLTISALRMAYWPSAVLVAMLLATPMSGRRRLLAVSLGVGWLHLFALARLGLDIQWAHVEVAQGSPQDVQGSLLAYRALKEVLNSNIVVIAAVFLGWVAVGQPRRALVVGSLSRLIGARGGGGAAS